VSLRIQQIAEWSRPAHQDGRMRVLLQGVHGHGHSGCKKHPSSETLGHPRKPCSDLVRYDSHRSCDSYHTSGAPSRQPGNPLFATSHMANRQKAHSYPPLVLSHHPQGYYSIMCPGIILIAGVEQVWSRTLTFFHCPHPPTPSSSTKGSLFFFAFAHALALIPHFR
jgi:hypothetical protein